MLVCSVNPARGFGPAMVSRTFHQYWIFWVGPLVGSFVAVVIYEVVFKVRVSTLTPFFTKPPARQCKALLDENNHTRLCAPTLAVCTKLYERHAAT